MRIEGMDELLGKLDHLQQRSEDLHGEHEVSFEELFPPPLMAAHTNFSDMDAMLEESPWEVDSSDDFEQIPDSEWDRFVSEHTRFENWQAMMQEAVNEWARKKLEL